METVNASPYPSIIQHIRQFISLDKKAIQSILHYSTQVTVKKKALLLQEGNVCRNMYFVEKGCLRLYFVNTKGIEQTTQFAIENWWLADFMSFANQSSSKFNIQAIENSEVIAIEHSAQEQLLQAVPGMEKYFRIIMQKGYAASQVRFRYFYEMSKEENYRFFINSFPDFVQRIPQYMLASYLGFTPEYLSELRKKLS